MFSWSLSCADKICGIKIVQSFSWSHNCADFLFVESKLCRQVCSWRQSCAGKIWSHNCADNTCVLWSQTVQAFLVMSKLCRQEFAWEVKTVQAFFCVASELCRQKICYGVKPAQTNIICRVKAVHTTVCLESERRRQQNVESKLCRYFVGGVKTVQIIFL